ncbi:MAG: hypothetical protein FJ399_05555 [Verrucomicrobia bacterium]|nr:hypothetical protein [Verrucomicrobiota bacterium]
MKAFATAIYVALLVCSAAGADLPQLFAKSEVGLADAELKVQRTVKGADGSLIVTAAAVAGKETVSFQVVIPAQWRSSVAKEVPIRLSTGTITLRSVGKDTEAFVRALATAYRQKIDRFEFTEVTLTAISLMGDPGRVVLVQRE